MGKISSYPAAVALFENDELILRRGSTNRRISHAVMRKLFSLQPAPWDVTGAQSDAYPNELSGCSVAQIPSTNDFDFSFIPSVANITRVAMAGGSVIGAGQAWAKFEYPSIVMGDTVQGMSVVMTNDDATVSDLQASFQSFPTLVGSVDWIVLWLVQGGASAVYFITKLGGLEAAIGFAAVSPGDTIYCGIDFDSNEMLRQVNAGAIQSALITQPLTSYRMGFIAQSFPEPPVFSAGSILVSLGTSDGGRTPFQGTGDAIPPAGAADGMRFVVQNSGSFSGKKLNDGDVAEFYDSASKVIVTPHVALSVSQIEQLIDDGISAATPSIVSTVSAALQPEILFAEGKIDDIIVNTSGTSTGKLYMIGGSPFGDISSFQPGSMAVLTDSGWVNFTKTECSGRLFSLGSLLPGDWFIVMENEFGLSSNTDDPYFFPSYATPSIGVAGETEISLRSFGWVLSPAPASGRQRRRDVSFSGVASGSITQDTADIHFVNVSDGDGLGNFTLFMGVGSSNVATSCIVVVWNVGAGALTVNVGAQSYPLPAGNRLFFRAFGDPSQILQSHAIFSQ